MIAAENTEGAYICTWW